MAKSDKKSKKVVKTTAGKSQKVKKVARLSSTQTFKKDTVLVFGKENYKWVGVGLLIITLGMILMIGGFNENPNVWDESKIYGFQRTVLAPFLILTGLAVQIYAIFKN